MVRAHCGARTLTNPSFPYFFFLRKKMELQELPAGPKCNYFEYLTYGSWLRANLPGSATSSTPGAARPSRRRGLRTSAAHARWEEIQLSDGSGY
jgi:hypothetical protein